MINRSFAAALVLPGLLAAATPAAKPANPYPPARTSATDPHALLVDDQYVLGPDSRAQPGVPQGEIRAFTLPDSKTYPGFPHKWWLYIPPGYDGQTPLPFMVFLDGGGFAKRNSWWGTPEVLDNLIKKKQLPRMAALFVDPGDIPLKPGEPRRMRPDGRPAPALNRETEYDTLSGTYATFLIEEILPLVRQQIVITDDPAGRGICGVSSGGIGAFTVAWERPDQFSKVYTMVGTFVNVRGGDAYPRLVRESPAKPIRVFQQEGRQDRVNERGSWVEGNRLLNEALTAQGYDHLYVLGEGGHSIKHGASLLPFALRWLWRDYPR
jgi:enterochelin esterase-like enzyme